VGKVVTGLAVGAGSGMSKKRSFGSNRYEESKFLIFGHTSSKALFGTPNQVAIALKTASHGVVGINRPLPTLSGLSAVRSSGYFPTIFPPATAPPNIM